MTRDFRIENTLFWPHMRNTSYEAFFEQATDHKLSDHRVSTLAASMHTINRESTPHPILDLEAKLAPVLAAMEVRGVFIDTEKITDLEHELTTAIVWIEARVAKMTGETTVNLASPLQLQKLLFETLQIKPLKKTKTGWSVDEETLEILAQEHEICRQILEHRHASKLLSTYVRGLTRFVNPVTKRVHTTYDTLWASTGRFSSDSPNLQNIPAGDPWSDAIKRAFRPQKSGWSYVVADYSQIEIRILACLSGDEMMLDVFRHGRDLHNETGKYIFGKDSISTHERRIAKAVNFGVMYGISPYGLSRMIGKPPAECGAFIDGFFALYPGTRAYFDHVVAETKRVGYAETFFGRRRTIQGISDNNSLVREQAKREAMNMPIQGTCADILKHAMIVIDERLKAQKLWAKLIMQVHDELVIECPDTEISTVEILMKEAMEHIVAWEIPMQVEVKHGKNWKEAK